MSQVDIAFIRDAIAIIAIAGSRTTGILLVTPFLGRGVVPGAARSMVVVALTLPLLNLVWSTRPSAFDSGEMVYVLALSAKELLLGVLLGLPLAITVWGLEAAGSFIDNQRGATMASLLNPATGSQVSPLGIMLGQVYVTWLFVTGGFRGLLDVLYRSHQVWPMWSFVPAFGSSFPAGVLHLLDRSMRLAFLLAGPAILAMFLSELGLALVSRFAPQLQVFFLAMPVKSGVGMLVLMLSLGIILTQLRGETPGTTAVISLLQGWMP